MKVILVLSYVLVLGLIQSIGYLVLSIFKLRHVSWHEFRMLTSKRYYNELRFSYRLKRMDLIVYIYENSVLDYIVKEFNRLIENK